MEGFMQATLPIRKPFAACFRYLVPRRAVYFPKYVCINNPRLAGAYWCMLIFIVLAAITLFFTNQRQYVEKPVIGEVSLASWKLERPLGRIQQAMLTDLNRPFCTTPGDFIYESGNIPYTNIQCAQLCQMGANQHCISQHETVFPDDSSIFIPTFYSDSSPDLQSVSHHFVPGAEDVDVAFTHRFAAVPPTSVFFEMKPQVGGTGATEKEAQLLTVLINSDGEVARTFEPGEVVTLSIGELMHAASLDEYTDTVSQLGLDNTYVRVDEGIVADRQFGRETGPTLRLTGVEFNIALEYANNQNCHTRHGDPVSMEGSDSGKYCCLTVEASRRWTTKARKTVVDLIGNVKTRIYHGIRITFSSSGHFTYWDNLATFDGITTVLIWIQIPGFLIYYFIITFLGSLSKIYNRIIHESMSIDDACKGLAARLSVNSSAYLDLKEQTTSEKQLTTGITKQKLLNRFRMILKEHKDLDDEEIMKFVDFMFKNLAKTDDPSKSQDIIDIQRFCSSCATNEPMSFESLVQVFDVDRPLGFFERNFNDDVIREIREMAKQEQQEQRGNDLGDGAQAAQLDEEQAAGAGAGGSATNLGSENQDENEGEEGGIYHSLLEKIEREHMFMEEDVKRIIGKVKDAEEYARDPDMLDLDAHYDRTRKSLHSAGPARERAPVEFDNGTTFTGEWVGGFRYGQGTELWPDGTEYTGQWEVGKLHGEGKYSSPTGASYEGQWKNGKQHGNGVETAEDGTTYNGTYKNGKKHGSGTFGLPGGGSYVGEMQNDMMHGDGLYTWANGHKYQGQWEEDAMHGKGTYTWDSGEVYEGEYSKNLKAGRGKFTWPDGQVFEGEYADDKKHGEGVLKSADGAVVKGTWKEGKQHGPGTITSASGDIQKAQWENGEKQTQ